MNQFSSKNSLRYLNLVTGLVLLLGLITACSDSPTPTAESNSTAVSSFTTPSPATVLATVEAIVTPTTTLLPVATTPVVAPTASPNPTTVTATLAIATTTVVAPIISPSTTPVPFKPSQKQVAPPNCCFGYSFVGDGRVLFYDKPAGQSRTGAYTITIDNPKPQFVSEKWGNFTAEMDLVVINDRTNQTANIEQVVTGARVATIRNMGTAVSISPDKKRIAYLLRLPGQNPQTFPQVFELWAGNLDGSNLRRVWTLRDGFGINWLPDNRNVIIAARDAANQKFGIWQVDLNAPADTGARLLVEGKGIGGVSLNSNATRLMYSVTLQSAEASGTWTARLDGSDRRKLDWVGGWRFSRFNENEVFYIPSRNPAEAGNAVYSFNFSTGLSTRLTDPTQLNMQVALGEWQLSPDATTVLYRSATDNALWAVKFAP